MEKQEFNDNDALGRLIRQSPLDCPPDGFVDRVMSAIQAESAVVPEKTSFLKYVNLTLPYAALVVFCMVFFFYSDLPFLNRILGQGFVSTEIMSHFEMLITSLKSTFSSRYITYGFLIGLAGGFLFLVDRFFSRRTTI